MKISGSAHTLYPVDTFFGLLYTKDKVREIPHRYPFKGEWGRILSTHILEDEDDTVPQILDVVYLSVVEKKFYSVEERLRDSYLRECISEYPVTHIVIGMAPYGLVVVWVCDPLKSKYIDSYIGEEINVGMDQFAPSIEGVSLNDYCEECIEKFDDVKQNILHGGLPPKSLFVKYMQQFVYRYFPMLEKWDGDKWEPYKEEDPLRPQLDWCEESLYDGTYDKLHDGRLMNYHEAGKPKRLAVKWHVGKCEYSAYFWFDEVKICEIFDRFYGIHRDTKSDFIIRIDGEAKKYELALFRYGLKVPQVIPATAYQMIVFKNKFEDYRSENYDQPHGAWIW